MQACSHSVSELASHVTSFLFNKMFEALFESIVWLDSHSQINALSIWHYVYLSVCLQVFLCFFFCIIVFFLLPCLSLCKIIFLSCECVCVKRKVSFGHIHIYPNGERAQFDHILINKKWKNSAMYCQSYNTMCSVQSDHRIPLSLTTCQILKTKKVPYDWSRLQTQK